MSTVESECEAQSGDATVNSDELRRLMLAALDGASQAKIKSTIPVGDRSRDIDEAEDVEAAAESNALDCDFTQRDLWLELS